MTVPADLAVQIHTPAPVGTSVVVTDLISSRIDNDSVVKGNQQHIVVLKGQLHFVCSRQWCQTLFKPAPLASVKVYVPSVS